MHFNYSAVMKLIKLNVARQFLSFVTHEDIFQHLSPSLEQVIQCLAECVAAVLSELALLTRIINFVVQWNENES
jgi:hypothetical protein